MTDEIKTEEAVAETPATDETATEASETTEVVAEGEEKE